MLLDYWAGCVSAKNKKTVTSYYFSAVVPYTIYSLFKLWEKRKGGPQLKPWVLLPKFLHIPCCLPKTVAKRFIPKISPPPEIWSYYNLSSGSGHFAHSDRRQSSLRAAWPGSLCTLPYLAFLKTELLNWFKPLWLATRTQVFLLIIFKYSKSTTMN